MRLSSIFRSVSFLLTLAFAACHAQKPSVTSSTVVYVVRHAEKADPSDPDTPLSPAGVARAQELARVLAKKGISVVYATEFQRTQQTVWPLANSLGLSVEPIANSDRATLLDHIRNADKGKHILVAGHGNTVPDIVRELSGEAVPAIAENEFDNLYEVVLNADGTRRLTRSTYGAPPQ